MQPSETLDTRWGRWWPPLAFIVVLLFATALRVRLLGAQGFWYDESVSVSLALMDWGRFVALVVRWETNMTLYHVLLRLWVMVAGDGESAVRALSAIWSVATLPVVYALGTRLFSRRAGLIAMLLLAANAFHIAFAQEARGYSMTTFFVALAAYFFVRGVETRVRASWAGYSLAAALATYSHFFGVFILAIAWASLAFLRRREIPWRQLVVSTAAVVILIAPLVIDVLFLNQTPNQIDWIPPTRLREVVRLANAFAGAGGFYGLPKHLAGWTAGVAPSRMLLLIYTVLAFAGVWELGRALRSAGRSLRTWRMGFILTWLVLPVLLTIVISLLKPLFILRYLLIALPALPLLAAVPISQIRSHSLRAAVVGGVLLLAVYSDGLYYSYDRKEDWRGFTRYVLTHAQPGDAIVFSPPFAATPFNVYYRKLHRAGAGPDVSVLAGTEVSSARFTRLWVAVAYEHVFALGTRPPEIRVLLLRLGGVPVRDFDPGTPVRLFLYKP